jgi:isoquinoline 1-oxidoreductase beta subunit
VLGDHPQFSAEYAIAPAFHATLETNSVTLRLRDGRAEIWAATQAPETAREAAAQALGLPVTRVILYPMAAGGSFDSRFDTRPIAQAATIAKAIGKPVQLVWSRWQDHIAGLPRAPLLTKLDARADTSGSIAAWRAKIATPASAREFGHRLFGAQTPARAARHQNQPDPMALQGASPPYAIPHLALDHAPVTITLPTGRMRGGPHALHAFATESFLDEIATALKREPLSFRMAMLGQDPRLAACLQRVSALAGWNGGQDQSGNGLACHRIGPVANGGCIAAIATARRSENGVKVDRIFAVADIGRIINTDIARQQIEGGILFGLGLAIATPATYERGLPTTSRLGQLGLPLLADCPQVEVDFIASTADPFDPGELGVAIAAPAIANALFSATGIRFRRLPLSAEE